ncbi:MAG: hypothetical protein HOP25_09360 [Methylotenera sp.]|nr:hypothetical protein [Methylotenera sp.]
MVRYRRNVIAGATYFFTVTLRDRRATYLVDYIADLRAAFRLATRVRRTRSRYAVCRISPFGGLLREFALHPIHFCHI